MSDTDAKSRYRITSSIVWLIICAAIIRGFHVYCWPQIVWGMNHMTVSAAKQLWIYGSVYGDFPLAPLPPYLLAIPSWLTSLPPGRFVTGATVIIGVLHAVGFYFWLLSLRVPGPLRQFSCLALLFLPFLNGYTSLGSLQTSLAATVTLCVAALINIQLQYPSWRSMILVLFLSGCLPWIRAEYCLLLPLYLVVIVIAESLRANGESLIKSVKLSAGVFVALSIGAISAMSWRHMTGGEFALAPREYSCWTFLDGVPSRWLERDSADYSEYERRLVGVEHFGHPAEYGYSLPTMALRNPGETWQKFAWSLPRWWQQLCLRDQTVPRPAALLALIGLLFLLRRPWASRCVRSGLRKSSLIIMTLPVAAIMIHPEYLHPAYAAICCLMSYGALAAISVIRGLWPTFHIRRGLLLMVFALCFGMEYLYFRSGANLADRGDESRIGWELDRLMQKHSLRNVVIDPYSGTIDGSCRTALLNWHLEQQNRSRANEPGSNPPLPMNVFELVSDAEERKIDTVIVWGPDSSLDKLEVQQKWNGLGFRVIDQNTINAGANHQWGITIFHRKTDVQ